MKEVTRKTHPTLGLTMIMKDEIEDLDRIVKDYGQYFDKLYVTVTDKKTHTKLLKKIAQNPAAYKKVELSFFKWIDHFGKARLYNQQQVQADYWMWIDLDDEIEGAENIREVVDYMETKGLNMAWFKYDYIQRLTLTEPGSILWRERIVRTASKLTWRDQPVHETIDDQKDGKQELLSQVVIKHRQTAAHTAVSGKRNKLILERDWQKTHRAETAFYLGEYLAESGDYEDAIKKLSFVTEHSKSDMFRFAAWQYLFTCYYQIGKYDAALTAANACIAIDRSHPDSWFYRFLAYWAMSDHSSAMQSAEIAMSLRGDGERAVLRGHDPTFSQYKAPFDVAQAYLSLGNTERAYQLYSEVKKIAPQYIEEQSLLKGARWGTIFEQAYSNKHVSN